MCRKNSKSKWKITGIVSFGDITCGNKKRSGVYVNVSHYREWINEHTNKVHTLYNVLLRIARNLLETRENVKISTHPFFHTNLD